MKFNKLTTALCPDLKMIMAIDEVISMMTKYQTESTNSISDIKALIENAAEFKERENALLKRIAELEAKNVELQSRLDGLKESYSQLLLSVSTKSQNVIISDFSNEKIMTK